MTVKQRGQNLKINDTVQLKLFTYNGSTPSDVSSVEKVDIFRLYATDLTTDNPMGKVLVETICDISHDAEGQYSIQTDLTSPKYTVDRYSDEWQIVYDTSLPAGVSEQFFTVYPNSWFVDSQPIVYDFSFDFTPNKIVKGSKKYITIQIDPNVGKNTDKLRYYRNLVSGGDLYISVEQGCGDCLPAEEDLRLVVDRVLVTERDFCLGYYFLDTTEMACGMYFVWFELELGPNVYVSDKQPLQIFQ